MGRYMNNYNPVLAETEYKIYSESQVIRLRYQYIGDQVPMGPRIKKVYKSSKGHYILGQGIWERSRLYLENYEEKLNQWYISKDNK